MLLLVRIRAVIVTGLFLAEYAEVVDDKLSVSGGVFGHMTVETGPDSAATPVFLVALIQFEPGDLGAGLLQFEIFSPDGELAASNTVEVAVPAEAEHGFRFEPILIRFLDPGRYAFAARAATGSGMTTTVQVFSRT